MNTGAANMEKLADVQSRLPRVPLMIDCVGVRGLRIQLGLRDRARGMQTTVAKVDLGVDLPASRKGTHMSRLVEALENWHEELDYQSMKTLLQSLARRLEAGRAWASFSFPYLVARAAPFGGKLGTMAYNCVVTGELKDGNQSFLVDIEVPVMTVCPCSKEICREGAHSQRALVRMKIRITNFVWIEDFIDIAENSASSSVYTLLKREDEKFVTEMAFSRPAFVEDVAREVAQKLDGHPDVLAFAVEVESMESIHNHNAFARIERPMGNARGI